MLFSKDHPPRCGYCKKVCRQGETLTCPRRGTVDAEDSCRRFQYDPLKRTPRPPAELRRNYTPEDFTL